jgi:hypothetical protein
VTVFEETITKLKFIDRHDYANPNAKVVLNRNECKAILNYIRDNKSLKSSEHCTDCFNENNEIVDAVFAIVTKYSRFSQYYCRHHFVMRLDLFAHQSTGASRFIHYEIKRLRQSP